MTDEGGDAVQRPRLVHPLLGVPVGHPERGRAVGDPVAIGPLLNRPRRGEVGGRALDPTVLVVELKLLALGAVDDRGAVEAPVHVLTLLTFATTMKR